jgi:hypothetical protein
MRVLLPFTATGEQLSPVSSSMSFLRLSSTWNQSAHSGRTGRPNRTASRCSTKSGESSYSTVRLPGLLIQSICLLHLHQAPQDEKPYAAHISDLRRLDYA